MTTFESFQAPLRAVVIGASGGIGSALVAALLRRAEFSAVHALSRRPVPFSAPRLHIGAIDILDEQSVAQAADVISREGPVDIVIVATGVLHDAVAAPEKRWESVSGLGLGHLFAVNAIGPALCARHFLPLLRADAKAVFAALSARVGSISDNRTGGWYGYRAAKAALNMLLKTYALELARRNPRAICIGLHPGTVDTALSRPFQASVPEGKLFTPDFAAGQLLEIIANVGTEDSGLVFAWDGTPVPP